MCGQKLEPAIECILIVHSRKCSIEKKLEALKERYDTYSAEDFKRGRFGLYRATDFKDALKKCIEAKEKMLVKMFERNADYVFIITEDYRESDHCVYRSLDYAMDTIRTNVENTRRIIVKTKLDS